MSKKMISNSILFTSIIASLSLASCGANNTGPASSGVMSRQKVPLVIKNASEAVENTDVIFEKNRAVELNDDFSNIDDVRDYLNNFTIKATLKYALDQNATFVCSKIIGGDEVVKTEISAGSLSKAINIKVGNNEVSANITCRVIYQEQEIAIVNYNFTKSLLIDSETKLDDISLLITEKGYEVDRLIFLRGGVLITNGASFTMNANKLYSQDAFVQTFSIIDLLGQTKNNGQKENLPGKSGGTITINSLRSTGKLTVNMFGQNGNDQAITPGPIKSMGTPGVNAVAETYHQVSTCPESNSRRILVDMAGCHATHSAENTPGSPATRGGDGENGRNGLAGNQGGNSGSFNLISVAENDLEIVFEAKAGTGGAGAPGGIGGLPGPGGARAGKYPAAPAGTPGAKGIDGRPGENGLVSKSCTINSTSKTKKCS